MNEFPNTCLYNPAVAWILLCREGNSGWVATDVAVGIESPSRSGQELGLQDDCDPWLSRRSCESRVLRVPATTADVLTEPCVPTRESAGIHGRRHHVLVPAKQLGAGLAWLCDGSVDPRGHSGSRPRRAVDLVCETTPRPGRRGLACMGEGMGVSAYGWAWVFVARMGRCDERSVQLAVVRLRARPPDGVAVTAPTCWRGGAWQRAVQAAAARAGRSVGDGRLDSKGDRAGPDPASRACSASS